MNKTFHIKDHSVSQETFSIVYDEKNQLYRTEPIPDNLNNYYASENYISHTDSHRTLIDKIYQKVKKINLNTKTKLIQQYSQSPTLLDIGAGTGDFVKVCQQKNWKAYGIEPNPKAREFALKKNCNVYENYDQLPEQQYDIITLWHVLEHIPDVNAQMTRMQNMLKPNGIIIIAVPNYKSWDAKHYKQFWAAWDVPRHLWHFSKHSIEMFAQKINYKIEDTKPMWFDAFYVSILSEEYKTGKKNFIKAIINGMRSNLYGMLKNEFSSQIYVLKKAKN